MQTSRLDYINPELIEVNELLSTNFATKYVKEVMAVNPLRPVLDKIDHKKNVYPLLLLQKHKYTTSQSEKNY